MHMQGERSIKASRADVWRALNDAEVLKSCISGCDEMEKTSGTTFEASVVQKVGPMKVRFRGSVELSDIVKENSYTITGEGKGGAAGFAKGQAKVQLTGNGADTLLTYEVEAKVGGKLAQLGSRLIAGFARKMTDEFFNKFQQAVEGTSAEDKSDKQAPEEKKKGWFRRVIG